MRLFTALILGAAVPFGSSLFQPVMAKESYAPVPFETLNSTANDGTNLKTREYLWGTSEDILATGWSHRAGLFRCARTANRRRDRPRNQPRRCNEPVPEELRSLLTGSKLFDLDWYVRAYSDAAEAGADPFEHYITTGAFSGRRPNPYF